MFKKLLKGMTLAAVALGLAVSAQAATVEVNLYGASAQYLFWNDLADDLCAAKLCTVVGQNCNNTDCQKGSMGVTVCDCGDDDLVIRYTSKASYDGIYACQGVVPPTEAGGQDSCQTGATTPPGPKGPAYRAMLNGLDPADSLGCYQVTIGASDVAGKCFGQESHGRTSCSNSTQINRVINAIDDSTMEAYKTVVVPFGFFRNNVALPTVTSLTATEAAFIFSGNVTNWSTFPRFGVTKEMAVCYRHAGSGTHATLYWDVMAPSGYLLPAYVDPPYTNFNNGSSDEMVCINNNGCGQSTDTFGAIGYADCDQSLSSYTNTARLQYQGVDCNACNIRHGSYPFWSAQYLYVCAGAPEAAKEAARNMITYSQDNIPATKAAYWNTYNQMMVDKDCGGQLTPKSGEPCTP